MYVMALLEMPLTRRLVPLALALVITAGVLELIRRRKLLEDYAMSWLVASGLLLVVAVMPDIIIWLQDLLDINYLTIVIVGGFALLALGMMHFAVIASRYAGQIRQLSQRQALLERELRASRGAGAGEPGKQA